MVLVVLRFPVLMVQLALLPTAHSPCVGESVRVDVADVVVV